MERMLDQSPESGCGPWDVLAWSELMMLPKCVLRAAGNRAGKKHQRKLEADTKERCRAWKDADRGRLWAAGVEAARPGGGGEGGTETGK